jgi:hypothetical protein
MFGLKAFTSYTGFIESFLISFYSFSSTNSLTKKTLRTKKRKGERKCKQEPTAQKDILK